jgi:hypothetical protein
VPYLYPLCIGRVEQAVLKCRRAQEATIGSVQHRAKALIEIRIETMYRPQWKSGNESLARERPGLIADSLASRDTTQLKHRSE